MFILLQDLDESVMNRDPFMLRLQQNHIWFKQADEREEKETLGN